VGELADERVDLAQGQRRRGPAFEIAPDEAIVGDAELQGGGTAVLDDGGTSTPRISRASRVAT
jgi:hypothetical protein